MKKSISSLFLAFIAALMLVSCSNEKEQPKTTENTVEEDGKETVANGEENEGTADSEVNNEDDTEIKLEDLDPIPTDISGLSEQLPGPYADADNIYDMEEEMRKEFEKIGPMSENPSDEEYEKYLRFMYSLVAKDYPNPEDLIKKLEFGAFGNPDLPDSRYHFKENYNIEILLDSSGSMANYAGSKTRMEVAKEAINDFLKNIPEEANVSLRVYGHKGTGADSDKALSCKTIEQVYGYAPYDEDEFENALNQFDPAGWTPLAGALKSAQESIASFDASNNTNLIYVVSDGIETCDGDPVKVAEELANSSVKPIINIIGFQTDAEAQKQLEEMARVANGIYTSASNQEELQAEFKRAEEVLEVWEEWKKDALRDADANRVDNSFNIVEMTNDWYQITTKLNNHLAQIASVARRLDFITFEQNQEIDNRREEIINTIDSEIDNLKMRLEEINNKNLEEMKKEIEETFEEQSQE